MAEIKEYKEIAPRGEITFPNATFLDATEKEKLFKKSPSLIFLDLKVFEGKGTFVVVQAKYENKEISFSIGGVVADQLQKAKESMPFKATIATKRSKDGKMYYVLE